MTGDVIDGHERQTSGDRDEFGRRDTDEQCPHQPRRVVNGDTVDDVERHVGISQSPINHRQDIPDVRTAGDFGHDTGKAGMEFVLRRHNI